MINSKEMSKKALARREEIKEERVEDIFNSIHRQASAGGLYIYEYISQDYSFDYIMEKLKEHGYKVSYSDATMHHTISWGD